MADTEPKASHSRPWREEMHRIIFGTETPAGKAFDVLLLWAILVSVLLVVLESVQGLRHDYGQWFRAAEWGFTILFTIEYGMRLVCVRDRMKYTTSFFGVIDLLAILPTYLEIFFEGSHYLMAVRALRLVRVFRVLKLMRHLQEGRVLLHALKASRPKITVFMSCVLTIVVVMGTAMYLVEGPEAGFTSIPKGIYWAIVTLSTVGYGDLTPQTVLGQFISCIVMILGYAIIAVPTGIVSLELHQAAAHNLLPRKHCSNCGNHQNDHDAQFCKLCGHTMPARED